MHFRQLWENKSVRYKPFRGAIETNTLIVGGGMTGLSAAYHSHDKRVVLIEQGIIGEVTGRGTGILCPGLDVDFKELVARKGSREAGKIIAEDKESLKQLKSIIRRQQLACDLEEGGGLAIARTDKERVDLKKEYLLQYRARRPVRWVEGNDLQKIVNIKALAAMYTEEPVLINQEKFLKELACRLEKRVAFYERTPLIALKRVGRRFQATTPKGNITANRVILSAGSGDISFVPKRKLQRSTCYVVATRPLSARDTRALRWRTARTLWTMNSEYDFLRMTTDRRLIIGGEDSKNHVSFLRKRVHYRRLKTLAGEFFPQLRDLKFEYEWSGDFYQTRGMKPDVGQRGNLRYGFAYGGTGLLVAFRIGKQLTEPN